MWRKGRRDEDQLLPTIAIPRSNPARVNQDDPDADAIGSLPGDRHRSFPRGCSNQGRSGVSEILIGKDGFRAGGLMRRWPILSEASLGEEGGEKRT
jgi:hypothetical protein